MTGYGTPTPTNPNVASGASVTIAAAREKRSYLEIQNNSAGNVMIGLAGQELTGIVPTLSNKGFVLEPGASWVSSSDFCPDCAITCYQTSGVSINTISVLEF